MNTITLEDPTAAVQYPVANCATQVIQLLRWAKVAGIQKQIGKALASLGSYDPSCSSRSISLTLQTEKETLETLSRMLIGLLGHYGIRVYPFKWDCATVMESEFAPLTARLQGERMRPILEGNGLMDIHGWVAARKMEGLGVSVFSALWSYFFGWAFQLESGMGAEGPMGKVSLILPFIGKSEQDGTFRPLAFHPRFGEPEGNGLLVLPVSQVHYSVSLDHSGKPKFPRPCIAVYQPS